MATHNCVTVITDREREEAVSNPSAAASAFLPDRVGS